MSLRAKRRSLFFPYLVCLGIVLLVQPLLGVVGLAAAYFVYQWDQGRRSARISYDLADATIAQRACRAALFGESLSSAGRLWHITHSNPTNDRRRNAGASALIQRTVASFSTSNPAFIDLNFNAPCILVGPQRLLFLPDQLVVWDDAGFVGLAYEGLRMDLTPLRFIEEDALPSDAVVVDKTWRFVRNDGGPDLRFNGNRQLPVARYWELELTSPNGLRIRLQVSSENSARVAAQAFAEVGGARHSVGPAAPPLAHLPAGPAPHELPDEDVDFGEEDDELDLSADSEAENDFEDDEEPEELPPLGWSVAVLFRYVAAADRKITPSEVQVAQSLLSDVWDSEGDFAAAFRALPSDLSTYYLALDAVQKEPIEIREWVLDCLHKIAMADGRVTPKEEDRIQEIEWGILDEAG